MGGMDMMDFNLGDHSPFSKFALNWVEPKVISGVTGTVSFELNSFQETGDFAILTPKNYTSSAFDEYFVTISSSSLAIVIYHGLMCLDFTTYSNVVFSSFV